MLETGQRDGRKAEPDTHPSFLQGPLWASAFGWTLQGAHRERADQTYILFNENYKRQLASFKNWAVKSQLVIEKEGATLRGGKSPTTKLKPFLWYVGRMNK